MESIFKFKKVSKQIGDFSTDDPNEWVLLKRLTSHGLDDFIHFRRLWLVEEKPEIQADPDNGIEYQAAVTKEPRLEVYTGFMKEGKFVVERQNNLNARHDVYAQAGFLKNLQMYVDRGYTKDWVNYNADNTVVVPAYHGHEKQNSPQDALSAIQAMTKGVIPSGMNPHIMIKPQHIVHGKTANTNNNP